MAAHLRAHIFWIRKLCDRPFFEILGKSVAMLSALFPNFSSQKCYEQMLDNKQFTLLNIDKGKRKFIRLIFSWQSSPSSRHILYKVYSNTYFHAAVDRRKSDAGTYMYATIFDRIISLAEIVPDGSSIKWLSDTDKPRRTEVKFDEIAAKHRQRVKTCTLE